MRSLRPSYYASLVALLAGLVLTVTMPLAQHACAMMDALAEHAEREEHSVPDGPPGPAEHSTPEVPPCHGEDSAPADAPASPPTAAMPCCVLVAVGAPAPPAPALGVAAVLVLPNAALASPPSRPVPSPDASPPGRPIPLHIALGRFLT